MGRGSERVNRQQWKEIWYGLSVMTATVLSTSLSCWRVSHFRIMALPQNGATQLGLGPDYEVTAIADFNSRPIEQTQPM